MNTARQLVNQAVNADKIAMQNAFALCKKWDWTCDDDGGCTLEFEFGDDSDLIIRLTPENEAIFEEFI